MSSCLDVALRRWVAPLLGSVVVLQLATAVAWAQGTDKFPGIARAATAKEVAAWDIDVRPDFKGLPKGSGTVLKGQAVWEGKCASCHGIFGESNEVFSPLVGGTTADDVKTGRVARLKDGSYPGRTTLMKVPHLSTLWDYINRAMPWTQPKSLTADEVYAVTAFLLNLGGVVPDDFTLSDQTIAQAQARMPNRNGMSQAHALWPGKEFGGNGRPDVKAVACMTDCMVEAKVASLLPDYARNAHGNLAEQNRAVGAQRGADTSQPETRAGAVVAAAAPKTAEPKAMAVKGPDAKAALALASKYACTACHGVSQKIVGPAFSDVGKKHAGQVGHLQEKITKGSAGAWGPVSMPPQSLPVADARLLAEWLAAGAPSK